jgi:hypothetical protein
MPWGDVAGAAALLEELFDQAQGYPKAIGNLGASALVIIVTSQDSFPQIQGDRSHIPNLPSSPQNGYSFY